MAGSFSTSHNAKITFKIPELNNTAHISAPSHVKTRKSNYDVIFGRKLLLELGIQLVFQNYFIVWQNINRPMKPME